MTAVSIPHESDLAACVVRATTSLQSGQLVTGEIPTYRNIAAGTKLYAPSVFMSAMAHDALGCLDPRSRQHRDGALRVLSSVDRRAVTWRAGLMRAGIRRFLAWQEEADRTWCFYGRGSALHPDAATTACAALALAVDSGRTRPPMRWRAHNRALERFRTPAGLYHTFTAPDGSGYAWIGADGARIAGFDRVVNAHVLRFVRATGAEPEPLAAYIMSEVEHGEFERGSPEHPDPVSFVHAVARAWTECPAVERGAVRALLVPWLHARQQDDGGFGGPLSTALALAALVDLGDTGDALDRASHHLLTTASDGGEWSYQPYLSGGQGSAPFTTALSVAALVGWASVRRGRA